MPLISLDSNVSTVEETSINILAFNSRLVLVFIKQSKADEMVGDIFSPKGEQMMKYCITTTATALHKYGPDIKSIESITTFLLPVK
jgi:hypothetical protein